jgi:hypothetical protein
MLLVVSKHIELEKVFLLKNLLQKPKRLLMQEFQTVSREKNKN